MFWRTCQGITPNFTPSACKHARFLQIEVNTGNSDDPTEAILAELRDQPLAGAIVRVIYQVPPERAALVRTDEIRRALAPAHLLVALSREMPPGEARNSGRKCSTNP